MKKSVQLFALVFLIALLAISCSGEPAVGIGTEVQQAIITVTGSGQVLVIPDVAYINIGVRSTGDTVVEAIAQNNEQAQAIQYALTQEGIEEKDIQTSNFNVYQQSDYDYQGNPTRTYYSVENTVYVTVVKIDKLGDILDAVARSGANNIYGVNFDIQDKSEAQKAARELAVQAAQSQARELAAAAGIELGELLSISSSPTSTTQYYGYGYGMGGGGGMDESVPIASGQMPINAQVEVSYEIK